MAPGGQKTSGLAIGALVCGIVACCIPLIGLLIGIVAVILGILAMKQINANPAAFKGKGMAIAGLVCGGVAIVVWLIYVILFGFAFSAIQHCLQNPNAAECKDSRTSSSPDHASGSGLFVALPAAWHSLLTGNPPWLWA